MANLDQAQSSKSTCLARTSDILRAIPNQLNLTGKREDPRPFCWSKTKQLCGGQRPNFLRLQRYNVIEAKDGLDALSSAQDRNPIHLVVTDVVMPRMSGGALAKEIARLRPETQFVFVSGYAGKTILDHKVVDLETNFLQKPFTLKQLSSKIRRALDGTKSA